jgi:predicted metallopeptidase
MRGFGSSSRGTIARCHALNKVMQKALNRKGFYVLEFLSERFDKLSEQEKIKVLIHEIMHIPKSFGGGFKHHDYVCERNINHLFRIYMGKNGNLAGY